MLQAMKEEPPLAAKCKDKFLIQSTFITPNKETMNLKEIVRATFPLSHTAFIDWVVILAVGSDRR